MADELRRMEGYTASDISDNIAEVREARGTYDSLNEHIDAKQDKIDASHKLDPALVDFSAAQQAALDSGVTTEDVEQIETNKNNISSLTANGGGKNKLQITATPTAEMTINADKSVSITTTATTAKQYNLTGWIPNNYVGMKISGMTVNSNVYTGFFISVQYSNNGSSWVNETDIATIGSAEILNYPYISVRIVIREGNTLNGVLFKPMISDNSEPYQPYALSNAELTDNTLIEEITSGITVASGYTKSSTTHVYKQGKHIFGTLVFEKSSGSYSTTGGDIVGTMGNYAPVAQWLGCGFFSDSVWTLKTCGYAFIQNAYGQGDAGQIIVTDSAGGTNKIVKIQIDYVMP